MESHRGERTPPGHLQPFLGLNFYLVLVGGNGLSGVCPGAFGYSLDEECVICLRDGDEPRAGAWVGFSQSSKLSIPVWSDSKRSGDRLVALSQFVGLPALSEIGLNLQALGTRNPSP